MVLLLLGVVSFVEGVEEGKTIGSGTSGDRENTGVGGLEGGVSKVGRVTMRW